MRVRDLDAYLFDAGGVLVLPDPTVLAPLLVPYGGSPDIDVHIRRALPRRWRRRARRTAPETLWDDYNHEYVRRVGVGWEEVDVAAIVLERTRSAWLWRWPIASSVTALRQLHEAGVPIGVVSNASGQIADVLRRFGVCQVGPGDHTPVRVIVDSHVINDIAGWSLLISIAVRRSR